MCKIQGRVKPMMRSGGQVSLKNSVMRPAHVFYRNIVDCQPPMDANARE
jgi:hypothetical protein